MERWEEISREIWPEEEVEYAFFEYAQKILGEEYFRHVSFYFEGTRKPAEEAKMQQRELELDELDIDSLFGSRPYSSFHPPSQPSEQLLQTNEPKSELGKIDESSICSNTSNPQGEICENCCRYVSSHTEELIKTCLNFEMVEVVPLIERKTSPTKRSKKKKFFTTLDDECCWRELKEYSLHGVFFIFENYETIFYVTDKEDLKTVLRLAIEKKCSFLAFDLHLVWRLLLLVILGEVHFNSNEYWGLERSLMCCNQCDVSLATWMMSGKPRTFDICVQAWSGKDSQSSQIQNNCQLVECKARYLLKNSRALFPIWRELEKRMRECDLLDQFTVVESRLAIFFSFSEQIGVVFDMETAAHLTTKLDVFMRDIEVKAHQSVGKEFSLLSSKQLSKILFEELGLKCPRKCVTATGHMSTSDEVLEILECEHELPSLIRKYRRAHKLFSYIEGYRREAEFQIDSGNGSSISMHAIHAYFLTSGTETGRMSCVRPNLQNIPLMRSSCSNRTVDAVEEVGMRDLFVCRKDRVFLSADYDQIELRVFAALCQERVLIRILNDIDDEGNPITDVHKEVAARVFQKDVSSVTDEERSLAKRAIYGVMYGAGHHSLGKIGGQIDGEHIFRTVSNILPCLQEFTAQVVSRAEKDGFVKTACNIRHLPVIHSSNPSVKSQACRQAINTIVQGNAAAVVKKAIHSLELRIQNEFSDELRPFLAVQVHDELVFEVPERVLDKFAIIMREEMVAASESVLRKWFITEKVRFSVTLRVGNTLGSLKRF